MVRPIYWLDGCVEGTIRLLRAGGALAKVHSPNRMMPNPAPCGGAVKGWKFTHIGPMRGSIVKV